MKKVFTLVLIAGISMLASTSLKANTICFTDGFGYVWNITYSSDGSGHYAGTGTVNIGSGVLWSVSAWSQLANLSGSVELHAVNPLADNCNSGSTDSFVYVGTCAVMRSGGHTTSYSGSGGWSSYCSGGVYSTGTWDASGPCGGAPMKINANGPASHSAKSLTSFKSSNTVCFTDAFGYVWNITYSPNGSGGYWGTGTVNIGSGTLWNVNASGEFASLSGDVQLHALNPNPDGCNSYSDSFVYVGSAQVFRSSGSTTGWSGSGGWTSYCFGGALNSGTWDASGPCGGTPKAVNPNGPATHGSMITLVVSPNPANNHSVVSFKLTKQSQVNVTVYNYLQQPVKVLASGNQAAGKQSYNWDLRDTKGSQVTNGVYRVVAVINGKSYTASIQVVR